ncbi:MAG TPA: serine/threonine-protein kinase [Aggregicoccus sp.]|nr:serine/threonine-protein kinase [Aggregicoccus sp.]
MSCPGCAQPLAHAQAPCERCGALEPTLVGASQAAALELEAGVPTLLDGKWRLERKLGEGGMGTVFLAHDVQLERKVAVKLMSSALLHDAELVGRFEREARVTAGLEHPHVVPVYAVGREAGRPYMVMKCLAGRTLAALLRERGSLPLGEVLALMRQLCAGLDFIHSRGFVHRDIKSPNLFIGWDGHATILDFGILRSSRPGEAVTLAGTVIGTPQYMAPEQALGLSSVDHRADLYALAVVLFECLAGSLPFDAPSDLSVIHLQANAPPPDLCERAPGLPRQVAQVLRRALSKAPEARYPTAGELFRALAEAAQGAPLASLPDALPIPLVTPAPPPRRRSLRAAAVLGLALASAAGLALASRRAASAAPEPTASLPASARDAGTPGPVAAAAPQADAGPPGSAAALAVTAAPSAAASAPAAPLERGTVSVVSTWRGSPYWASLRVDGAPSGTTPAVLKLPVGEHRIVLERSGFRRETHRVQVKAETPTALRIELRR